MLLNKLLVLTTICLNCYFAYSASIEVIGISLFPEVSELRPNVSGGIYQINSSEILDLALQNLKIEAIRIDKIYTQVVEGIRYTVGGKFKLNEEEEKEFELLILAQPHQDDEFKLIKYRIV